MTGERSGVDITGLEEVKKLIGQFAIDEGRSLARSAIHAVAIEVKNLSKKNAPVGQSRDLKKAIFAKRIRPRNPDKPYSDVRIHRGKNARYDAYYWHFLEYGTNKQPAQPFIRPALKEIRPRIVPLFKHHFTRLYHRRLKMEARKAAGLTK